MRLVTLSDIRELKESGNGNCITLTMPTTVAGAAHDKNRILFKTLVGRADAELEELKVPAREREKILSPARRLEDQRPYWKSCSRGLAAYISMDRFRTYRLPFPLEEGVEISGSFNTRPLIDLVCRERRYFLLALGLGDNRLFEATPHSIREIPADSLPGGMLETLRFDVFEKHLQGHTTSRPAGAGARMTFHGHDSEKEERRSKIRRYIKEVAAGISELMSGETAPLVVASLHYLLPDFASACDYPHLSSENLAVDPGHMSIDELHRRSLTAAGRLFERELDSALERYGNAAAAGTAVSGVEDVLLPAWDGRVETLLVVPGYRVYGRYIQDERLPVVHGRRMPGDIDLVSLAVERTLLNSGRIFTAERERMPDGSGVAAILRY